MLITHETQVKGEIHVMVNVEDCSTGPAPGAQSALLAPFSADESPLAKTGLETSTREKDLTHEVSTAGTAMAVAVAVPQ